MHVPASESLCTSQAYVDDQPKQGYPTAPVTYMTRVEPVQETSERRRTFSFKEMHNLLRGVSVVVIITRMWMKDGVRMRMAIGILMTMVAASARYALLSACRVVIFGNVR